MKFGKGSMISVKAVTLAALTVERLHPKPDMIRAANRARMMIINAWRGGRNALMYKKIHRAEDAIYRFWFEVDGISRTRGQV